MGSVAGIARRIIASGNDNILEDYYRFYNDGKWIVEVSRKVVSTLSTMGKGMAEHMSSIPKMEECLGYIEDSSLDEMGVASCAKELRESLKSIKGKYSEWEKSEQSERERLSGEYKSLVDTLREYMESFVDSCENAFRNRYVDDEENVRNLLEVIHSTGNAVLNNGAGGANSANS